MLIGAAALGAVAAAAIFSILKAEPWIYYDKPLGQYVRDYDETVSITISRLRPEDILTDSMDLALLEATYDGNIIDWDVVAGDGSVFPSDLIGTCSASFRITTDGLESIHAFLRTHSVKSCAFWKNISRGQALSVIGELNFQGVVVGLDPYTIETELHVRPMVVRIGTTYYIDNNLPKSVTDQLIETLK